MHCPSRSTRALTVASVALIGLLTGACSDTPPNNPPNTGNTGNTSGGTGNSTYDTCMKNGGVSPTDCLQRAEKAQPKTPQNHQSHKPGSLFAAVTTAITFNQLMNSLNTQTDAQIANNLTTTGFTAGDAESMLLSLSPSQRSQLAAALPKSRFYSIFGSLTDANAQNFWAKVYFQTLSDGITPPGW